MRQEIHPNKDAFVFDGNKDCNYGKSKNLYIGLCKENVCRSLLNFDLCEIMVSNISSITSILSMKLRLYVYCKYKAFKGSIYIYKLKGKFLETMVTWNNQPDIDEEMEPIEIPFKSGTYNGYIDIPIDINWIDKNNNLSIEIRAVEDEISRIGFTSREYGDISMRPLLIVDYHEGAEQIIKEIQSGNFIFNSITNIEKGIEDSSTISIRNIGDEGSSAGLAVLQLSYGENDTNQTWVDSNTEVIFPGQKKALITNAARKKARTVVVSTKEHIINGTVGGQVDIKEYLQVDTDEDDITEDYNYQVLLRYESDKKNMPVNRNGIVTLNEIGNAEVRIYVLNVDSEIFISIRVCNIIDAINQGVGNVIYLPEGEIILPENLEFTLNRNIEIIGAEDSEGKPLTSLSKVYFNIHDNNPYSLTIKNIIVEDITEDAGINICGNSIEESSGNGRIKLENLYLHGNDIGIRLESVKNIEVVNCFIKDNRIGCLLDNVQNGNIHNLIHVNIRESGINCNREAGIQIQGQSSYIAIESDFFRNAAVLLDAIGILIKNADEVHHIWISKDTRFIGFREDRRIVEEPSHIYVVYNYVQLVDALSDDNINIINIIKLANHIVLPEILNITRKITIEGDDYSFEDNGIKLNADEIVINNLYIQGSITIDVGEYGNAVLTNVEAEQDITILSGGINSIHLNGVTSPKLNIHSNSRVIFDESKDEVKTNISQINIVADSEGEKIEPKLEFHGANVNSLTVEESAEGTLISEDLGTSIGMVTLNGRANLDLYEYPTHIDTVLVQETAAGTGIIEESGAYIGLIIFMGRGELSVIGESTGLGDVVVEETAENTSISVDEKAELGTVELNAVNTRVTVNEGSQIRIIDVNADNASIKGDGAAQIIVDGSVTQIEVEGYEETGDTAIVSKSMAFYLALDKSNITMIKMNNAKFPLVDKHLDINKEVTIIDNNIYPEYPKIQGTITIASSNVKFQNLHIDASNTYTEENNNYSALLVNSGVTDINIIGNKIDQDYNGITVLDNSEAVIKSNTIKAVMKSEYVTNGIQIGKSLEGNQNIDATIDDNTITGNFYNNIFEYASAIYIKSTGNITVGEQSYEITTKEAADNLVSALNDNNTINSNEIKTFVMNPSSINEVWCYLKGKLFNDVKNINMVETVEDMKRAIEDPYLALNLNQYNKLSEIKKLIVSEEMLEERPSGGYYDKQAVQNELDYLVGKKQGPVLVNAVPPDQATDVPLNVEVKAYFDINIIILNSDLISIIDSEGIPVSGVAPFVDPENNKSVIIDHDEFNLNTEYTVIIEAGAVESEYYIPNEEDIIWRFTTSTKYKKIIFDDAVQFTNGKGIAPVKVDINGDFKLVIKVRQIDEEIVIQDDLEVTIVDVIPKNNDENVEVDAEIKVIFGRGISYVDSSEITIKDSTGGLVQGVRAEVDVTDNRIIVIAHDNFNTNTQYTVTIPEGSVIDIFEFPINKRIVWLFKTLHEK